MKKTILLVILFLLAGYYFYTLQEKSKAEKIDSIHRESVALFNQGRYGESISKSLEELALGSKNPNTLNNIGMAYTEMNDYKKAVEYHERAIKMDPAFGHGYYSLGRALHFLKEYDKAKEKYLQAINAGYRTADVYFSLGNIQKFQEAYKEAIGSYKEALKRNPSYLEANFEIGQCYEKLKKYDFARKEYRQAANSEKISAKASQALWFMERSLNPDFGKYMPSGPEDIFTNFDCIVVDETDRPVPGAVIKIHSLDRKSKKSRIVATLKTDSEGHFKTTIKEGMENLSVEYSREGLEGAMSLVGVMPSMIMLRRSIDIVEFENWSTENPGWRHNVNQKFAMSGRLNPEDETPEEINERELQKIAEDLKTKRENIKASLQEKWQTSYLHFLYQYLQMHKEAETDNYSVSSLEKFRKKLKGKRFLFDGTFRRADDFTFSMGEFVLKLQVVRDANCCNSKSGRYDIVNAEANKEQMALWSRVNERSKVTYSGIVGDVVFDYKMATKPIIVVQFRDLEFLGFSNIKKDEKKQLDLKDYNKAWSSEVLDIVEATFRYQFDNNASARQDSAKKYFLSVAGDPPAELMKRFAGHNPPVDKISQVSDKKEDRMTVKDKDTGEYGLKFRVSKITWIADDEVQVEGGYYEDGLSSSGNIYHLIKINGVWIPIRDDMLWIS